jgi:hypothetical protein
MPKGVLGIEAVAPFVSDKPDAVPAQEAKSFPHPRQEAIAIVPQWGQPVLVNGVFQRFPVRVNSQMTMGQWSQDGIFTPGPGARRIWEDGDILRPEMLTKYPQLEASIIYLLGVLEAEAAEAEVI